MAFTIMHTAAIPHINSEANPPPPSYQYCLQVSETVL